jgi:Protein of unknown function (DUF3037)
MQEDQLFEYAVIRVVPKVEREEFLNVGVILLCAKQKFLQTRVLINEDRLRAVFNDVEMDDLKNYIRSFELISAGGSEGGPIGCLSLTERFRWLTATRSTVVQTSKVHPGLCVDAKEMLDRLFEQLVVV